MLLRLRDGYRLYTEGTSETQHSTAHRKDTQKIELKIRIPYT